MWRTLEGGLGDDDLKPDYEDDKHDEILGVLSKITDFSSLTASAGQDASQLYVNCHHLLSSLDVKSSLVCSLVSFLTNICTSER